MIDKDNLMDKSIGLLSKKKNKIACHINIAYLLVV